MLSTSSRKINLLLPFSLSSENIMTSGPWISFQVQQKTLMTIWLRVIHQGIQSYNWSPPNQRALPYCCPSWKNIWQNLNFHSLVDYRLFPAQGWCELPFAPEIVSYIGKFGQESSLSCFHFLGLNCLLQKNGILSLLLFLLSTLPISFHCSD